MGEYRGEYGEGDLILSPQPQSIHLLPELIIEKKLTFEQVSNNLHLLGKDESGINYAYLMLTLNNAKLTDISIIAHFKHVLFIDLSGNLLNVNALQILIELPYLVYLKVEKNRLDSGALMQMQYLQVLILNYNQISETCDIKQPFLECLELNFNVIFTIHFNNLEHLKQLDLRGNHLTDLNGTFPINLEKLYAPMNRIRSIVGANLNNLTVLHLRDNRIRKLDGFCHMSQLKYLNLRNNCINKRRQFHKLNCLTKLQTIVIIGNPVLKGRQQHFGEIKGEQEMYGEDVEFKPDPIRMTLIVFIPNLNRIDKEIVTMREQEIVLKERDNIFHNIMEEDSSDEENTTAAPTTTTITAELTTDYNSAAESEFSINEENLLEY